MVQPRHGEEGFSPLAYGLVGPKQALTCKFLIFVHGRAMARQRRARLYNFIHKGK